MIPNHRARRLGDVACRGGVRRLLLPCLSPKTRYVVWLLLVAKLVLAPFIFWPFAVGDIAPIATQLSERFQAAPPIMPGEFETAQSPPSGNSALQTPGGFGDESSAGEQARWVALWTVVGSV